jgi:hypothetical protein
MNRVAAARSTFFCSVHSLASLEDNQTRIYEYITAPQ